MCLFLRKRQDSNLRTALGRSTVFEAASFSHSDTLPLFLSGPCPEPCAPRGLSSSTYLRCKYPDPAGRLMTASLRFRSLPGREIPVETSNLRQLSGFNKFFFESYGISTALTIFSASSTKASPSGLDESAAGSPASPFSRMLCTIGICPRSGTPYFSAIFRPPPSPKI